MRSYSRSARRSAPAARGCSISPATSSCRTATRSRRSSTAPIASRGAATRRRAFCPAGRRTAPFSDRGLWPRLIGARGDPSLGGRPHHRDRLRRRDGRCRRSPPGGIETLFPPGPPRDCVDQFADAVHDEGDLRAMPAAPPRPGDRPPRRSSSPASTRTRKWTASISAPCAAASRKTASRKSLPSSGSTAGCSIWANARQWRRNEGGCRLVC
jgi:hypothetical protein